MPRELTSVHASYRRVLELSGKDRIAAMRALCLRDLFFLLTVVCGRVDMRRQWVLERCDEVQARPDGHLDLWARFHWKSSIQTFGKTLQDILNDPELTFGILSFNRPTAKAFLNWLRWEIERNVLLRELFPDILWENPDREAPKWSEDGGIIVKRRGNPKEATVEAWGLTDGQPTARHWQRVVYDDVVVQASVTTPEMIAKTTQAWELSLALIAEGGRRRYLGTRYAHGDTYSTIIDRGAAIPRIRRAVDDDGKPVVMSVEDLESLRKSMAPLTWASQMMLEPTTDSITGFQAEWLRFHDGIEPPGAGLNVYIVVDPAHSKRKDSDWTVMWVIGCGSDRNYHVCHVVRDRLNLRERIDEIMRLHRIWRPRAVGYEQYGLQADIEAIRLRQAQENYRFDIVPLASKAGARAKGTLRKPDRIAALAPVFEAHRIWLPYHLSRTIYDGTTMDLIHYFTEHEYKPYPAVRYDDMMDALARILDEDLGVVWPKPPVEAHTAYQRKGQQSSWMSSL